MTTTPSTAHFPEESLLVADCCLWHAQQTGWGGPLFHGPISSPMSLTCVLEPAHFGSCLSLDCPYMLGQTGYFRPIQLLVYSSLQLLACLQTLSLNFIFPFLIFCLICMHHHRYLPDSRSERTCRLYMPKKVKTQTNKTKQRQPHKQNHNIW